MDSFLAQMQPDRFSLWCCHYCAIYWMHFLFSPTKHFSFKPRIYISMIFSKLQIGGILVVLALLPAHCEWVLLMVGSWTSVWESCCVVTPGSWSDFAGWTLLWRATAVMNCLPLYTVWLDWWSFVTFSPWWASTALFLSSPEISFFVPW